MFSMYLLIIKCRHTWFTAICCRWDDNNREFTFRRPVQSDNWQTQLPVELAVHKTSTKLSQHLWFWFIWTIFLHWDPDIGTVFLFHLSTGKIEAWHVNQSPTRLCGQKCLESTDTWVFADRQDQSLFNSKARGDSKGSNYTQKNLFPPNYNHTDKLSML